MRVSLSSCQRRTYVGRQIISEAPASPKYKSHTPSRVNYLSPHYPATTFSEITPRTSSTIPKTKQVSTKYHTPQIQPSKCVSPPPSAFSWPRRPWLSRPNTQRRTLQPVKPLRPPPPPATRLPVAVLLDRRRLLQLLWEPCSGEWALSQTCKEGKMVCACAHCPDVYSLLYIVTPAQKASILFYFFW
ncbi:hypothetical protein K456DRAFT_1738871 [Colletotrichum gloeosporioides 23]|nr:hypothetical protein K456DRAFT_1738871 [Colletotrichum gloeosporioides 23]